MNVTFCHDCGAMEGETHEDGCDVECCPICHEQAISCGCSKEDQAKYEKERFIYFPVLCARCGKKNPEFFYAEDWEKYIPKNHRKKVFCEKCYQEIKWLIDRADQR